MTVQNIIEEVTEGGRGMAERWVAKPNPHDGLWMVETESGALVCLGVMEKETANGIASAPELAEVARAYEQWEADLILDNEAWRGPYGQLTLPIIPQHLWDRLLEIQAMRNKALEKVRGEG